MSLDKGGKIGEISKKINNLHKIKNNETNKTLADDSSSAAMQRDKDFGRNHSDIVKIKND